jgi:hypothetical protein
MSEIGVQLVLIVTATYAGAIGYGEVYDCSVQKVVAGSIDQPRIPLTVLAGDERTLQFINAHLQPARIEITFTLHRRDEPYSTAPITGFVDKSRTSWTIDSIREAK